jgi:NAD-dependent dihydropyrimidine dehydrogenase PreA subunit
MLALSTAVIRENFLMNKIVDIDESLCIACGQCVEICPKKILFINTQTNKCKVIDENKCGKTRCCEKICPVKAIKIVK